MYTPSAPMLFTSWAAKDFSSLIPKEWRAGHPVICVFPPSFSVHSAHTDPQGAVTKHSSWTGVTVGFRKSCFACRRKSGGLIWKGAWRCLGVVVFSNIPFHFPAPGLRFQYRPTNFPLFLKAQIEFTAPQYPVHPSNTTYPHGFITGY